MKTVVFPNWLTALTSSGLHPSTVKSNQVAVRRYLSYLKIIGEPATVETARQFVESAIADDIAFALGAGADYIICDGRTGAPALEKHGNHSP